MALGEADVVGLGMRSTTTIVLTLLLLGVKAQQPLPPAPDQGPGYSDLAPGTMLVESGRMRNIGIYTTMATTIAAFAISRSNMDDAEGTAVSLFGCGVAIGLTFNLVGNGKQVEAGKAMQQKGY